jgi:hypothetical protein
MIYLLLAAYGLTFALQHKISWLHGIHGFFDSLLACTFCTGFHAGWIMWLVYYLPLTYVDNTIWERQSPWEIIPFAFAAAGTSYLLDSLGQHLEPAGD